MVTGLSPCSPMRKEPDENEDGAWVFQPELIVRAVDGAADKSVSSRRLAMSLHADDPERDSEMIYRRQVEFATRHGVAVHAKTEDGEVERLPGTNCGVRNMRCRSLRRGSSRKIVRLCGEWSMRASLI